MQEMANLQVPPVPCRATQEVTVSLSSKDPVMGADWLVLVLCHKHDGLMLSDLVEKRRAKIVPRARSITLLAAVPLYDRVGLPHLRFADNIPKLKFLLLGEANVSPRHRTE